MQAAWYTEFGSAPDVLQWGERPTPDPAAGEVRVRIHVSGINPVDVKRRAGGRGPWRGGEVIPHFDGAGVIDAVGEGVDEARIGERVWVFEAQWQRPSGTAAQYCCVPDDRAVVLPEAVSFAEGACLGIPAMTAYQCLFADGPIEGQTVLVTGGAGAVGNYAIQFAKRAGATVISTVSSLAKEERATAAGADEVIDYRRQDVAAGVKGSTDGVGVDRIVDVDFGRNLAESVVAIRRGGVIATYASQHDPRPQLPFYQLLYKNVTVRMCLVFMMDDALRTRAVEDISTWLGEGSLQHHVAETFALEEIVTAHEAVQRGTLGKVVLELGAK